MSKRIPIFLGFLLVAIAIWSLITTNHYVRPWLDRLENLGYDLQLRTRVLTQPAPTVNHVAIIDIDDKSLSQIGHWPWSRNKLANLVTRLAEQGAVVIAFDIFFSEPEPNIAQELINKLAQTKPLEENVASVLQATIPLFDNDAILANSFKDNSVVLALGFLPTATTQNKLPTPVLTLTPEQQSQLSLIESAGYISNIPILQEASVGSGFINASPDADGIIRRATLLMEYKNGVYPSLALQAVMQYLGVNIELITPDYAGSKRLEGIMLGSKEVPTDDEGQVLIPFIGKSYTFPYYSAVDVLNNQLPQDALTGRIVFIGTSATGVGDLQATSIESPFPGVEIQATLVNGMLDTGFSYIPPWTLGARFVIVVLFGTIAALLFPYFGPRILGTIIVFLPPLMLLINNLIWQKTGLILSLLIPVLLILLIALLNIIYGYLFETRKREQLKEMFGQYVPEKHIDEMIRHSGTNYGLKGENREMSVLFADIRSFTSISEGMPATELVEMLNTFFTPMTEIIFKHRGTIDKYVGDLIMAFWGAPLKDKHHARHAIESALEMQKKVQALRPQLSARDWPAIHIGIGINSGLMNVGDMGSQFRRNYTVLGDSVNLASRVEGLSKFYGADIVVTENTQAHQSRFIFRKLDLVRVKGKKEGVGIYEVLCLVKELTPQLQMELENYDHALNFYLQQNWDASFRLMEALHHQYPDKRIYKLYMERINEFKQNPPPVDWDGIFIHTSK